jgi:hypothetical protein
VVAVGVVAGLLEEGDVTMADLVAQPPAAQAGRRAQAGES